VRGNAHLPVAKFFGDRANIHVSAGPTIDFADAGKALDRSINILLPKGTATHSPQRQRREGMHAGGRPPHRAGPRAVSQRSLVANRHWDTWSAVEAGPDSAHFWP
jgi:hypothetical protein